jgi:hypothetical protein
MTARQSMPATTTESAIGRGARLALLISVGLTLILYLVPGVRLLARPLIYLSTFAHEMGHGIAALLVGGHFHSFEMWSDASGVARTSYGAGRLTSALVSAGGLVGPAVLAAALFVVARWPRAPRIALQVAAAALLLVTVLFVRSLFGIVFVAALAMACFAGGRLLSPAAARVAVLFLAVQLALSVYSRGDYLFTATAQTSAGAMPSDVANIARALFLPYWFWGFLCGAFSVAVVGFGLWLLFRRRR